MQAIFRHLPGLLKMSWEASVLILLVLAVQWLCGPRLKPRWRCALWLLVLLRLALPWTIPSPASLFNVLTMPAVVQPVDTEIGSAQTLDLSISKVAVTAIAAPDPGGHWLAWLWAAGALALMGCAAINQYKFHRRVTERRPLIDGPMLNLLEDCKALMGVRTPVTLIETESVNSPALFGFVRPRLLLPSGLASRFTREELCHIFLHELAHIKRGDILAGWVMLGLQIIHWFNPLVWLAFHRLRADRELACDALALSHAQTGENEAYGLTIVKLLEEFGQSVWSPGLAGILENKQQIKERICMIAKFHKTDRGLALAVALLAGLALVTLTDAQTSGNGAASESSGAPRIIATSPAIGATGVDPSIKEITVTFDRDMQKGYSWTGSGPNFPTSTGKPEWRKSRTCVIHVNLEAAHYYCLGLNSPSYKGFRSAAGVAVTPVVFCFATQGAGEDLQKQMAREAATFFSKDSDEPKASDGVWAVRFEPRGDFAPKSPQEFLDKIHQYAKCYSGKNGEIGYFRTIISGDKLNGSFLASDPDQLKKALAAVPNLTVTSIEKLTQKQLVAYEKAPQESLIHNNQPDAAKGVWAVRFEPVDGFAPKTPGEFLDRANQSSARSGRDGEIGYFRTTIQGDRLVASFLAYDPAQLKAALATVPGLKVTSVDKLTPSELIAYEKSPQESLP